MRPTAPNPHFSPGVVVSRSYELRRITSAAARPARLGRDSCEGAITRKLAPKQRLIYGCTLQVRAGSPRSRKRLPEAIKRMPGAASGTRTGDTVSKGRERASGSRCGITGPPFRLHQVCPRKSWSGCPGVLRYARCSPRRRLAGGGSLSLSCTPNAVSLVLRAFAPSGVTSASRWYSAAWSWCSATEQGFAHAQVAEQGR